MATTTTTLKDKVTYITITPTPSSPTTSLHKSSLDSPRSSTDSHHTHHEFPYPFPEKGERGLTHQTTLLRTRRSRLIRRIRNIIVSIISLAVVIGLCSTGWWMRGVFDSYQAGNGAVAVTGAMQQPLNTTTTTTTVVALQQEEVKPVAPSPKTLPEVVAAATTSLEESQQQQQGEKGKEGQMTEDEKTWLAAATAAFQKGGEGVDGSEGEGEKGMEVESAVGLEQEGQVGGDLTPDEAASLAAATAAFEKGGETVNTGEAEASPETQPVVETGKAPHALSGGFKGGVVPDETAVWSEAQYEKQRRWLVDQSE